MNGLFASWNNWYVLWYKRTIKCTINVLNVPQRDHKTDLNVPNVPNLTDEGTNESIWPNRAEQAKAMVHFYLQFYIRHHGRGPLGPTGLDQLTGSFVTEVWSLVSFLFKGPPGYPLLLVRFRSLLVFILVSFRLKRTKRTIKRQTKNCTF